MSLEVKYMDAAMAPAGSSRGAIFRTEVAGLAAVTKNYGSRRALDGVNLTLNSGEILALLGPNGAGKTTAVKLLLGLLDPDDGLVRVFGNDPREARGRQRTGAMLQVARVPETLRVWEHIDLFSSYYPRPLSIEESMEAAGVRELANRKFGELSGGEKQRALFALALCGNPDLLFLDEPTVGMDVEARRGMWKQIRALAARGKSILLTTHYLEEAEALADRIVVLHRGRVIENGTADGIKSRVTVQVVKCRTKLTVEELLRFDHVNDVTREGDFVEIQTSSIDDVLRQLILTDPKASSFELQKAGLEEAFLTLTAN
jgi:ABC-2 type transport system ATP-binding protein